MKDSAKALRLLEADRRLEGEVSVPVAPGAAQHAETILLGRPEVETMKRNQNKM